VEVEVEEGGSGSAAVGSPPSPVLAPPAPAPVEAKQRKAGGKHSGKQAGGKGAKGAKGAGGTPPDDGCSAAGLGKLFALLCQDKGQTNEQRLRPTMRRFQFVEAILQVPPPPLLQVPPPAPCPLPPAPCPLPPSPSHQPLTQRPVAPCPVAPCPCSWPG
jgi:hypothetical protein